VLLNGRALFSLGLATLAAYAVVAALDWPPKARFFPLVMGIPLLALAAVQFVLDLRGRAAAEAHADRKVLAVFAWMAGFIVLVLLVGFPIAVPIFVFAYLAVHRAAGWKLAIALAAAAWAFLHLLFERLLHFPFDRGLIG
jgi:hypothetical protein